ncbi:hypothetical protein GG344DRAFT_67875 [Lentinula edodes]|nr:hypothetical protein GG344DRAFT_67875 [Lentinula edodes]
MIPKATLLSPRLESVKRHSCKVYTLYHNQSTNIFLSIVVVIQVPAFHFLVSLLDCKDRITRVFAVTGVDDEAWVKYIVNSVYLVNNSRVQHIRESSALDCLSWADHHESGLGVISISILRSIYRVVVLVPFSLDKNDYGLTIQTANTNMRFKNPGTMAFAAVDGAVTSTSCMQSKAIILWATLGITLISLSLLLCCLAHVWMVTKCFICVSTGTLSITVRLISYQ